MDLSTFTHEQLVACAVIIMYDLRNSWGYGYSDRIDLLLEVNEYLKDKEIEEVANDQLNGDNTDGRFFRDCVELYGTPLDISVLSKDTISALENQLEYFDSEEY